MAPHDSSETSTAALVAGTAHDLRNQLATLRAAARLVDDEEVASAITDATSIVQVLTERAAASARVELDRATERAPLEVDALLRIAVQRARREGRDCEVDATTSTMVLVAGRAAERLVADLLHLSRATVATLDVAAAGDAIELRTELDPEQLDRWRGYLDGLATACGCHLSTTAGTASLSMPVA